MTEVAGLSWMDCENERRRIYSAMTATLHTLKNKLNDNFHVEVDKCQPYYCHDDDDGDRLSRCTFLFILFWGRNKMFSLHHKLCLYNFAWH